jgi:hypothetical protein
MKAAFIPKVNDELDTQNFEKFEEVIHFLFFFLKCMKVQTYLRHFVANLVVSCDWLMML